MNHGKITGKSRGQFIFKKSGLSQSRGDHGELFGYFIYPVFAARHSPPLKRGGRECNRVQSIRFAEKVKDVSLASL
jgi:hypothetical protein